MTLRFRPALVPTLGMLLAVSVTGRLGVWQLNRYSQAKERIEAVDDLVHAEPLEASDLALPTEELDWRRIRLRGSFRDQTFVATGGIPYGTNGYALVVPFDVTDGPTLLVRRGWIPVQGWEQHVRDATVRGEVEVTGLLRVAEETMAVEPVMLPGATEVVWPLERQTFLKVLERGRYIPYVSMARSLDTEILPVVLLQGEELADPEDRNPLQLPADGFSVTRRMIHHLDYAGQWFVMGLIAFGIWVWHGVRRGRRDDQTPAE